MGINKEQDNKHIQSFALEKYKSKHLEAAVAQEVKRWSAVLANPGSRPAGGGNYFNRKRSSIQHNLSLSPSFLID